MRAKSRGLDGAFRLAHLLRHNPQLRPQPSSRAFRIAGADMARLTKGPGLIASGPPMIEASKATPEEDRDRIRDAVQPWRKWYYTARWRKLAARIRQRDGDKCRQTGAMLVGRRHAPNSPVVDHIVPHNGDEALFWDPANLQTVSKEWHDGEKQRQDKARRRLLW